LKPEQAETLTRARQSGSLALALRSIADANAAEANNADNKASRRGNSVEIIRYGVSSSQTAQK
jgi:pilus assembly protein CpaB